MKKYIVDGHTFNMTIVHPDHGHPFRPDIVTVVDMVTRKIVGFGVGLRKPSRLTVNTLRRAFKNNGLPDVVYTDNQSDYLDRMKRSDRVECFLDRSGVTHITVPPYNSPVRNMVERVYQTVWFRLAEECFLVVSEARKKASKIAHKNTRGARFSQFLMTWQEFMAAAERSVVHYNTQREHSGLLSIYDPKIGRLRHQTPEEAWDLRVETDIGARVLEDSNK